MSFDDLVILRDKLKGTKEDEIVAPYEHSAFVKTYLGDANTFDVLPKALGLLAAIPGYQLKKLVARQDGETPPSMSQVTMPLKAVAQGVMDNLSEPWKKSWNKKAEEQPAPPPSEVSKSTPKPWEKAWSVQGSPPAKNVSKEAYRAIGLAERSKEQDRLVKDLMHIDHNGPANVTKDAISGLNDARAKGELTAAQEAEFSKLMTELK